MKRILILLIILTVLGALLAYALYDRRDNKNGLVLYGNVDVRQVDLGFRVGGRITRVLFEEGDFILPGDLVAEIDNQPYYDQLKQAQANLQAVKTSFENAERVYQRRLELISDGSISQEDLDNALATKDQLLANLESSKAALGVAQTNFDDTLIFAPSAGSVLTRIREPGTVVKIGDPVYTVSLLSPVWVRAFVSEPYLGQIYPGMKAEVYTDNPQGKVYHGHIGFISPVAEFTPKNVETTDLRTDLVYRLRIITDDPDHGLKQGMPVTVKLIPEENSQSSSITSETSTEGNGTAS